MGSWLTRTRAWVYIAFYDEYVGRHINTCAGLSMLFFIPTYLYGIHVNRIVDRNANHMYYHWGHFDKRNRLTHNLIMEHFELHKERLEDLIIDLNDKGPSIFDGLKPKPSPFEKKVTMDDFALIDEISGLNGFLRSHLKNQAMSETQKERIRAHMVEYKSPKDKVVAMNELSIAMFGDGR